MTDRERDIRTISLCLAALRVGDALVMQKSLEQILEDHMELVDIGQVSDISVPLNIHL